MPPMSRSGSNPTTNTCRCSVTTTTTTTNVTRRSLMLLRLALVALLLHCGPAAGDILIYTRTAPQLLVEDFNDLPARFGPSVPDGGLQLVATAGIPADGCSALNPVPVVPGVNGSQLAMAVIVARGGCEFVAKVRNAQKSGYDAVIVHNVDSNELEPMSAKTDNDIYIPSVFVGELTGRMLIANYQYEHDYLLVLNGGLPFDINTHLILPFSAVVCLCFIIMMGFMIMKCLRERRRQRRHRLPRSDLKAIPVVRFCKSTMMYETCIICLDDYTEGEKLRVLPCDHAYHCKCIDIWLTKNRRVCPICKRRVLSNRRPSGRYLNRNATEAPAPQTTTTQRHHRLSDDSTSDSELDDSTPLLNPVEHTAASTNHGTFTSSSTAGNQRVNPFDRSPNLPPNLRSESASGDSRYQRFVNFVLRISNHNADGAHDGLLAAAVDPQPPTLVAIPSANLSGSLRLPATTTTTAATTNDDSDDDSTNTLRTTNIYEPTAETGTSSSSMPSRLGVVAIPNMEFSPSQPVSRTADVKPPNDFIV